jgi:hypothetical protein
LAELPHQCASTLVGNRFDPDLYMESTTINVSGKSISLAVPSKPFLQALKGTSPNINANTKQNWIKMDLTRITVQT